MTVSVLCGAASAVVRFAFAWSDVIVGSMCAPYQVVPPSGVVNSNSSTPACWSVGADPTSHTTEPGHVSTCVPPFVTRTRKEGTFSVGLMNAIVEMPPATVNLKKRLSARSMFVVPAALYVVAVVGGRSVTVTCTPSQVTPLSFVKNSKKSEPPGVSTGTCPDNQVTDTGQVTARRVPSPTMRSRNPCHTCVVTPAGLAAGFEKTRVIA